MPRLAVLTHRCDLGTGVVSRVSGCASDHRSRLQGRVSSRSLSCIMRSSGRRTPSDDPDQVRTTRSSLRRASGTADAGRQLIVCSFVCVLLCFSCLRLLERRAVQQQDPQRESPPWQQARLPTRKSTRRQLQRRRSQRNHTTLEQRLQRTTGSAAIRATLLWTKHTQRSTQRCSP